MHIGVARAGRRSRLQAARRRRHDARRRRCRSSRSAPSAPARARARPRAASPSSSGTPASASPCVRHPMPYGDLTTQRVQRFERYEDLDAADCTIEEREEYEPHLAEGNRRLRGRRLRARSSRQAEQEADVIALGRREQRHAVLSARRPHRRGRPAPTGPRAALPPGRDEPAHGRRRASSTRSTAPTPERHRRGARLDPHASTRRPTSCSQRRRSTSRATRRDRAASACSSIEDGPTLTHGEMTYGAACSPRRRTAQPSSSTRGRARSARSQRPSRSTRTSAHVLPAMGYGEKQLRGPARDDRAAATRISS